MFELPPEIVELVLLQAAIVLRKFEAMNRHDQLRVHVIIHDLPLITAGSARDLLLAELARLLASGGQESG